MAGQGKNRLLEALPADLQAILMKRMEPLDLPLSETLFAPGQVPEYAHFMTHGITSLVTFMKDGNGVEVGLVGCEGLVEALHLLGPGSVPTSGFVQVEGSALRMRFSDLQKLFGTSEPLRRMILRFVQGQSLTVNQLAACNRLHEVDERLTRWLLMVSDRLESNEFELTQEFLAEMLGTQRSTVTLAAGALQRSGLINYRRGHIQIVDREGMEKVACECYPIVKKLVSNLYVD